MSQKQKTWKQKYGSHFRNLYEEEIKSKYGKNRHRNLSEEEKKREYGRNYYKKLKSNQIFAQYWRLKITRKKPQLNMKKITKYILI